MSPRLLRRSCAALTSLALAGSIALVAPTSAEAATASRAYGGSSYGSAAEFGEVINLGRTANQPLCTTRSGVTRTGTTAAVNLTALGTIGVQQTKVQSVRSGSTQSSITTTTTEAINLLSGLVTADAIKVVAKVTFDGSSYLTAGSTEFVNLRVADVAVPDQTPSRDTTVALPLVGRLILNEQRTSEEFDNHTQVVTGLRLVVDTGTVALPAGQASVAYGLASLHSPKFARAYGNAYATEVKTLGGHSSARRAGVSLPCGGTSGRTRTNVAGRTLTGLLGAGAATTTARSTDSATEGTNATTTASVADISLLGGLVTADAVTAKASVTRRGSSLSRTSEGTTIVDLEIAGQDVPLGTGANQQFAVEGVGVLHFRRSSLSETGLQVYALQLVVTESGGGMALDTVINIGVAQAGAA